MTDRIDLPTDTVVLGGGTGTPKLLYGADRFIDTDRLTVVANTGDDVEFGELFVCPDIDSCLFAAAGIIDTDRWWGIADDTHYTAEAMAELTATLGLDGQPQFRPDAEQTSGRSIAHWRRFHPLPEFMTFGDRDRAIHRIRSAMLDQELSLTEISRRLGDALGAPIDVIPPSDDPIASIVHTPSGPMHFQEYWVGRSGEPTVTDVELRGNPAITDAVDDALDGSTVVIGPSNPITSIGPILAASGLRRRLEDRPVVAISPFLGASAFSGPAVDLMVADGVTPGTAGLPEVYPFIDGIVMDETDDTDLAVATARTDIRIETPDDARRVWATTADLVAALA